MLTILALGALTALGAIILLHKAGIKKAAGHDVVVDILISLGIIWLFAGTITGLLTGAVAGIIISLYLVAVKLTSKVEKLTLKGWVTA